MAAKSLSPHTKQPLYHLLRSRRLPFTTVAHAIEVPVPALRHAAYGMSYPSARMKKLLPEYLDCDLSELFEERVLAGTSAWQGRAYREDPEAGRATEADHRRLENVRAANREYAQTLRAATRTR